MSDASELPTVSAPFTEEQVKQLQAWQAGGLHPLTCPNSEDHGTAVLVPSADGLDCPSCDYKQTTITDPSLLSGWTEALKEFGERVQPDA